MTSLHFTVYIYGTCMVEAPGHGEILYLSFQLCIQRCQAGTLKSIMVKILTPWKSTNAINQDFILEESVVKNLPAHYCLLLQIYYNKSSLISFLFTGKKERVAHQNASYL